MSILLGILVAGCPGISLASARTGQIGTGKQLRTTIGILVWHKEGFTAKITASLISS